MNLHVIHNPAAGRRGQQLFDIVLAGLSAAGARVTVRHTDGPGHAARLAGEAVAQAPDRIVVAGGDGTINEVVNGLAGAEAPPLAIIPVGTANVLAMEIGLARRPDPVVDAILRGDPTPVTVGCIGDRRFMLMAGVGFDAHVVAGVDTALKRRVGKLAYAASFLSQMRRFGFPEYAVTIDGVPSAAASIVVANGRYYAGSQIIAPHADLRDPTLQVCRFLSPGRVAAVRAGAALFLNRLKVGRDFAIDPGRRIVIDGPAGDPVQADGDIVATLPVEITSLPGALTLVYPPQTD